MFVFTVTSVMLNVKPVPITAYITFSGGSCPEGEGKEQHNFGTYQYNSRTNHEHQCFAAPRVYDLDVSIRVIQCYHRYIRRRRGEGGCHPNNASLRGNGLWNNVNEGHPTRRDVSTLCKMGWRLTMARNSYWLRGNSSIPGLSKCILASRVLSCAAFCPLSKSSLFFWSSTAGEPPISAH